MLGPIIWSHTQVTKTSSELSELNMHIHHMSTYHRVHPACLHTSSHHIDAAMYKDSKEITTANVTYIA